MRWWRRWRSEIRSLRPFRTSTTFVLAPTMAKWELVLPDLKSLSRSLQLVCQSGDAIGCPLLWRFRPLLSIRSVIRSGLFNLCFCGEGLQTCVAWGVSPADVLSVVDRSRCKHRVIFTVFKVLCGDDVCICLFPELFNVILFSLCCLVLNSPSIILAIIFLDMNQILNQKQPELGPCLVDVWKSFDGNFFVLWPPIKGIK